MNYQTAYDGYRPSSTRPGSARPRMQSMSYSGRNTGYAAEQPAYFAEPPRGSPTYPQDMNYRQPSTAMHAPAYNGGELSRYPSRNSYDDSPQSSYYDGNEQQAYDYNQAPVYSTSSNKLSRRRSRRHSTYGSRSGSGSSSVPFLDNFRSRPTVLKFKLKGGYHSGVTLTDAMENARLSGDKSYSHRELSADNRGNLYMKIVWQGYSHITYEIPVDAGYDGRMSLQTLMRRVSRACLHFIQSRAIPIHPDRIVLHSIEEIHPGTWQPVLTVQ